MRRILWTIICFYFLRNVSVFLLINDFNSFILLFFFLMLLDIRHNELTREIIGCAMRVHSTLGHGFPENIYQRSLAVELELIQLTFSREIHLPVFYKGKEVGARRADFLVEDTVLVELKAIPTLEKAHHNQIINYLTAFHLEVGLLINFGEPSLTFKRFLKNQTK